MNIVEQTHGYIKEAKQLNKKYNYFNTICEDFALEQARKLDKHKGKKGKLHGIAVTLKDAICVKGVESSAGSKILKGYKPPFNSTVAQRLIDEGAIIIGKTAQDEFGFGSFSTNVGIGFKIPKNPFDETRVCGGSSGGAAGVTQKFSQSHIAMGESTGGSIVCPAAFCGVTGLCPTYGLVSRYGLIDYGSSLDKIGPMAKTVKECELALDVIAKHDKKDSTSLNVKRKPAKVKKIAIIRESFYVDSEVKDVIMQKIDDTKIKYKEISLPLNKKYANACYYLLAMSEASTNLAKLSGIRYGHEKPLKGDFNEYFSDVRSEGFTKEAKRRIIMGTFARMAGVRDAYYIKAAQLRTKLIQEYKNAFKNYDVILTPTMPILPPKFKDIEKLSPLQVYMLDELTCGPNLAGIPHMSVPVGFSKKLPVGMMLIADHLNENNLIKLGKEVENGR
ncbi:MAG: amidase family protein [archaeon]